MPYKRRARLLVTSRGDDRPRRVAAIADDPVFAEWLDVRAGPSVSELDRADPESLAWPDLLVCVDAATWKVAETQAARPATCRLKRWSLSLPDAVTPATLDTEIRAALDCMVGGMRLLSRLDGAPSSSLESSKAAPQRNESAGVGPEIKTSTRAMPDLE